VGWVPAAWAAAARGADQRTPNLAAVVQQIVSRPGWVSGNALVTVSDSTRVGKSINGGNGFCSVQHDNFPLLRWGCFLFPLMFTTISYVYA
jgi:hypothetical protein